MKEFYIRDEIIAYLRAKGVFCWPDRQPLRQPTRGATRAANGVSDILGILRDGRALAIEVKQPKETLSIKQAEFLYQVNLRRAVGFSATCIEDVEEAMAKAGVKGW